MEDMIGQPLPYTTTTQQLADVYDANTAPPTFSIGEVFSAQRKQAVQAGAWERIKRAVERDSLRATAQDRILSVEELNTRFPVQIPWSAATPESIARQVFEQNQKSNLYSFIAARSGSHSLVNMGSGLIAGVTAMFTDPVEMGINIAATYASAGIFPIAAGGPSLFSAVTKAGVSSAARRTAMTAAARGFGRVTADNLISAAVSEAIGAGAASGEQQDFNYLENVSYSVMAGNLLHYGVMRPIGYLAMGGNKSIPREVNTKHAIVQEAMVNDRALPSLATILDNAYPKSPTEGMTFKGPGQAPGTGFTMPNEWATPPVLRKDAGVPGRVRYNHRVPSTGVMYAIVSGDSTPTSVSGVLNGDVIGLVHSIDDAVLARWKAANPDLSAAKVVAITPGTKDIKILGDTVPVEDMLTALKVSRESVYNSVYSSDPDLGLTQIKMPEGFRPSVDEFDAYVRDTEATAVLEGFRKFMEDNDIDGILTKDGLVVVGKADMDNKFKIAQVDDVNVAHIKDPVGTMLRDSMNEFLLDYDRNLYTSDGALASKEMVVLANKYRAIMPEEAARLADEGKLAVVNMEMLIDKASDYLSSMENRIKMLNSAADEVPATVLARGGVIDTVNDLARFTLPDQAKASVLTAQEAASYLKKLAKALQDYNTCIKGG